MKRICFFYLIFLGTFCGAQKSLISVTPRYFQLTRSEFNGNNALNTVAFMDQYWRLAGNTGYNNTIYYVRDALEKAGFKPEISGQFQPLTYKIVEYPMDGQAWDPVDASLTLEGSSEPLLSYKTNKNIIGVYSSSTPPGGVDAEVVQVKDLSDKTFDAVNVKGKVVFAETDIGPLFGKAVRRGAIGVLAYSIPAYNQPEKFTNSVQFQFLSRTDSARWGLLLSYDAKEKLKAALAQEKNKVHVFVQTKFFPSKSYTLLANINGRVKPEERFVISAHVQEPGANDNASGVGTALEMARTAAVLVNKKQFVPQRTITFLWGDEIVAIDRYIREDSIRRRNIKWGISLDMVGENTAKTGGTFLIEKIPDPSAIWTRGEEKHTEWGGGELNESQMFPNWFNDFVLNRCLEQASSNGWVVKTNPFEGGSDHTPFINARIPGLLMWHFTDVNYHTNLDRLEMVSPDEMKNVGLSALVCAFTLVNADEKTTVQLINEISNSASNRLTTEFKLSKAALAKNGVLKDQQHILQVWAEFYSKAFDTMNTICACGQSTKVNNAIAKARKNTMEKAVKLEKQLATK